MARQRAIEVKPPLSEMRAELRKAGKDAPKRLQKVNKRAATRVAGVTRAVYETKYISRSGDGAGSIRPLATQTKAQVAMGGPKAPYVAAQNFGRISDEPRKRQFPPKTEPDYFLYRTVAAEAPRIEREYLDELDALMKGPFPE